MGTTSVFTPGIRKVWVVTFFTIRLHHFPFALVSSHILRSHLSSYFCVLNIKDQISKYLKSNFLPFFSKKEGIMTQGNVTIINSHSGGSDFHDRTSVPAAYNVFFKLVFCWRKLTTVKCNFTHVQETHMHILSKQINWT